MHAVHLDRAASDAAKMAGQQLTLDCAELWVEAVLSELKGWMAQRRAERNYLMTFEEFREVARNHPASHKSWGALATRCKNLGLIEPNGYVKAKSVRTHSHPVMQWKIL